MCELFCKTRNYHGLNGSEQSARLRIEPARTQKHIHVPRCWSRGQWHAVAAGHGHHRTGVHGRRRLCGEVLRERIRHNTNHGRRIPRVLVGALTVFHGCSGGRNRLLSTRVLCVVQRIRRLLDVYTVLLHAFCMHAASAPLLSWQWQQWVRPPMGWQRRPVTPLQLSCGGGSSIHKNIARQNGVGVWQRDVFCVPLCMFCLFCTST